MRTNRKLLIVMESADGEQFICEICAKVLKSAANLRIHQRIHVGTKKYRCEQCNMRFHQKNNLKHHSYVHSGKRPYQCNFCSKGFNQPSNLQVHRDICNGSYAASDYNYNTIKVPVIKSEAMINAQKAHQIPLVGVFFAGGSAKLYRAYNRRDECLLRPISSEDMRKIRNTCGDGTHITISTVATVQQQIQLDECDSETITKFVLVGDEFMPTE